MKLFPILLLCLLVSLSSQDHLFEPAIENEPSEKVDYVKISYADMRKQLRALQRAYGHIMQMETAASVYNITSDEQCPTGVNGVRDTRDDYEPYCQIDIVTLGDKDIPRENKTQIYISGALHGNERLGPVVSYYLIEFLVSNFERDEWITYLLQNREIVITPMTNAVGYAYDEREERFGSASWDINRDFPYNVQNERAPSCLNTVSARVLYRLFAENLFVTSITFHGGTRSISYPWGSYNHLGKYYGGRNSVTAEAPDKVALHDLGAILADEASDLIYVRRKNGATKIIQGYPLGDMTEMVYPVQQSLEDWAYGAGWDLAYEATVHECYPKTEPIETNGGRDFFTKQRTDNIRTAIYLIEMDDSKDPEEELFGSRELQPVQHGHSITEGGSQVLRSSIYDKSHFGHDGHVNRNIRATMALIDMAKPYITLIKYSESDLIQLEFTVNGCVKVDEARVRIVSDEGDDIVYTSDLGPGKCQYLLDQGETQTLYSATIDKLDIGKQHDFTAKINIEAKVDQHFGKSERPDNVEPAEFVDNPQTHFARLRLQDYNIDHNGRRVTGNGTLLHQIPTLIPAAPLERIRTIETETIVDIYEARLVPLDNKLTGAVNLSVEKQIHPNNTVNVIFEADVSANFEVDLTYRIDLMDFGDARSTLSSQDEHRDPSSFGSRVASSLTVAIEQFGQNQVIFRGDLQESDIPVRDGQAVVITKYVVIDYSREVIESALAYGILKKIGTMWVSPDSESRYEEAQSQSLSSDLVAVCSSNLTQHARSNPFETIVEYSAQLNSVKAYYVAAQFVYSSSQRTHSGRTMVPLQVRIGDRDFKYNVEPYGTSCSEMKNIQIQPGDLATVTVTINEQNLTQKCTFGLTNTQINLNETGQNTTSPSYPWEQNCTDLKIQMGKLLTSDDEPAQSGPTPQGRVTIFITIVFLISLIIGSAAYYIYKAAKRRQLDQRQEEQSPQELAQFSNVYSTQNTNFGTVQNPTVKTERSEESDEQDTRI